MERYVVVDWYEDYSDPEILGIDLTLAEAQELATQRLEDTDGECDVQVYDNEMDKDIYSMLMENIYG